MGVSTFVPWTKFFVLNKVSQTSRTALAGIYKKEIPLFVNTIDINSIQPTTFILSLSFPSKAEIQRSLQTNSKADIAVFQTTGVSAIITLA